MKETYSLIYSDAFHYREYQRAFSLKQAKAQIARNVARYFAGTPFIEYIECDQGKFIDVLIRYDEHDNWKTIGNIIRND